MPGSPATPDRTRAAAAALLADRDDDGFDAGDARPGQAGARARRPRGLRGCRGDLDAGEAHLDEALALARDESLAPIAADVLAQLALGSRSRAAGSAGRLASRRRPSCWRRVTAAAPRRRGPRTGCSRLGELPVGRRRCRGPPRRAGGNGLRPRRGEGGRGRLPPPSRRSCSQRRGPRGAEDGVRRLRAALSSLDDHRWSRSTSSASPWAQSCACSLPGATSRPPGR